MSKRKVTELEGDSAVRDPKKMELEEEKGKKDGLGSSKMVEFEQGLDRAMEKLNRILQDIDSTEEFTTNEWSKLCTSVHNNFSKDLYDKFLQSLPNYITSTLLPIVKEREKHINADEVPYLTEVVRQWQIYKRRLEWLCNLEISSLQSLNEVGIMRLRQLVYPEIQKTATDTAIAFIQRQREGHRREEGFLLKNVVDIFLEVGIDRYMNDFESALLQNTAAYYSMKAKSWILEHKNPFPAFLLKAEASLKFERERIAHYLHFRSENKLLETVAKGVLTHGESPLFENHDSGWHVMLRDHRLEDLSRVYRLFSYIPNGLEPLAHSFRQHVVGEGTSLPGHADSARAQTHMVGKFIELHEKHLQYIQKCFMNDGLFRRELKEAFEVFCSTRVAGIPSAGQLLATYCDNILKTSRMNEGEFEDVLDKTLSIFAYISEKDTFAEYHRRNLAHRLLNYETPDDNRERSILRKLKQQCGEQFTSKMEKMLTDSTSARDQKREFNEYLIANPHAGPGIEFTAMVMAAGLWPSDNSFAELTLPPEMATCVEVFKEFYKIKERNKKLTWIYSMGICNIIGYFDSGMKQIIATPYQASALLLFNTTEILSYSKFKSHLNLTHEDTSLLLHTLACGRYKILTKYPDTKSVTQMDTFKFNASFTHKRERFSILPHWNKLPIRRKE